jgi:Type II secretion system (T2SS), protein E, N-terminal domain
MKYELLSQRGALQEGTGGVTAIMETPARRAFGTALQSGAPLAKRDRVDDLSRRRIPQSLLDLVPADLARELQVVPLEFNGERLILAAADPGNIAKADTLRFRLALDVRLVAAPPAELSQAVGRYYGQAGSVALESTLSTFAAESDFSLAEMRELREAPVRAAQGKWRREEPVAARTFGMTPVLSKRGVSLPRKRGAEMLFFTVADGERVLVTHWDGRREIVAGPRRVWAAFKTFRELERHVAHPGEFLMVRFLDGRQEHLVGPVELWTDPRVHESITKQECLQLAAKEAVVVYRQEEVVAGAATAATTRRIVYGPTLFAPQPGEWLHTFSWHASKGGSRGIEKIPNGLVFQKLWLMPDQMYHDVFDVRTADSAVITIKLMIFFELVDINRMLDNSHDPIGDFVNAATADVVELVGKHDFESFKQNTDKLNDLATYKQLTGRAAQSGYRISNVVYRGYGAAQSLQQMHDQAIEARTKLQLERETEQQSQRLEDFKLESQLARAGKRRGEQTDETRHAIELGKQKADAQLGLRRDQAETERTLELARSRNQEEIDRLLHAEQQSHLRTLGELGVDLTKYLTQGRADRVIELRGGSLGTHVHLERESLVDGANGAPQSAANG